MITMCTQNPPSVNWKIAADEVFTDKACFERSHSFSLQHLLRVVPVIGILNEKEAFKPTPNPAEVEAVFDAPLEMFIKVAILIYLPFDMHSCRLITFLEWIFSKIYFLQDENRRAEDREWMGNKYLIHFFDYETEGRKFLIWGLTAGILIRAASVIFQRQPPFLEQNPIFKVPSSVEKDTILP